MNIVPLPHRWRARAVVIAETVPPMSWFTVEELQAAEAFRLEKRRSEYLLSRAAAKHLAVQLGLAARPAECRIESRRIGSMHLSLSHSSPYAGAAIDDEPVGIDVQVVRDIGENAAHFFLTGEEIELMRGLALDDRMLHFWCAKEAVWKRLGGATPTLKGVPLSFEGAGSEGLRFAEADTIRIGELIVSLTRRTS